MDSRDRPAGYEGAECAACRQPVPAESARVLAERDDLAFVQLRCATCGSVSLAIRLGPADGGPLLDDGPAAPGAIGADDVLDMHLFLAGYRGDVRGLFGRRPDTVQ